MNLGPREWVPEWYDLLGSQPRSWVPYNLVGYAEGEPLPLVIALRAARKALTQDADSGEGGDFAYRVRNTETNQTIMVSA